MTSANKPIYFPGLNGFRAIAAVAVVVSHITLNLKEFGLNPYIFGAFQDGQPKGLNLAGYGVSIFFVLSGFLITYLLQAEKDIQEISVKKFYIRRILRIWPLYYLYLLIALIVMFLTGYKVSINSLAAYVFYAANIPFILQTTLPYVVHYWSLGVEEQFYAFWPWVNKKFNNHLIPFIALLITLLLGTKVVLHVFHPNSILESAIHITRFHCLMIGGLGAILYKKRNVFFMNIADHKITQSICWLIMLLITINRFHFISVIDNEIVSVVALCLIIGQIQIKNRIINLDIRIFNYLGKISYGIYVIHPLVIFLFSLILNHFEMLPVFKYPVVYITILAVTIISAHLSYLYFEKYFLNKKKKYTVVNSLSVQVFNTRH